MTNPLVKMRELQAQMKAWEQEIQELQANPQLKAELLFESELRDLLKTHGKTIHEAVQTVDPSFHIVTTPPRKAYKPRASKFDAHGNPVDQKSRNRNSSAVTWYLFTNPHTGQAVRTVNTLKKEVKAWIEQYGKEVVMSWRTVAPNE